MHGHVPEIKRLKVSDIESFIRKREKEIDVHFDFKVNMVTFKSGITMELIAIFDDSLIPHIKNFDFGKSYVGEKERPKEEEHGVSGFFKRVFHI
jgi:hypothetical protein